MRHYIVKLQNIEIMKRLPTFISKAICYTFMGAVAFYVLGTLTTAEHDEDVIASMSEATYREIVDTLTVDGNKPSDRQIVTYYFERYAKK